MPASLRGTGASPRHSRRRSACCGGLRGQNLLITARALPACEETASQIDLGSLIPSLRHPRTPASIDVQPRSLGRHGDLSSQSCTVILNPEKRKVGGSTPDHHNLMALTCGDACYRLLRWVAMTDRDSPFLTAGRRTLSHADRTPRDPA